jgi:DNA invertase Pin-like site-specific DNA recombinase
VLRQLLEEASKGEFDVVVVHTLDRWARNARLALETLGLLAQHQVVMVSITENLGYATPQGKMFTGMLANFAQYFSDMLGVHVKKGVDARAAQGLHLGSIPFGYASCWRYEDGERVRLCKPEHPGGVHLIADEAQAVRNLFQEYAAGKTTLAQQAMWLNGAGFRTSNTKQLPGPDGEIVSGPRLFTAASVQANLRKNRARSKTPGVPPGTALPAQRPHPLRLLSDAHMADAITQMPSRWYLQ